MLKSRTDHYGAVAVSIHWISAIGLARFGLSGWQRHGLGCQGSFPSRPHSCGHRYPAAADGRVVIGGNDCDVGGAKAVPYLSLLLHELATNAAKFGSLSVGSGRLDVSVATDGDLVRLVWLETGGPVPSTGGPAGFGSQVERSVACALNTTIERDWRLTGLVATIAIPKAALSE